MLRTLNKNTEEIHEVCLHHISGKYKTQNCENCFPDYDSRKYPNNYDCPFYDPQLQINLEKLIIKISNELKRILTEKEKNKISCWVNVMNAGLINCIGHKINANEVHKSLSEYLNNSTILP